jgi:hypothetical protein
MLGSWERWVFLYDLKLGSNPKDAPLIPLRAVFDQLVPRYERGDSVKLVNKDSAAIRLQRLHIDKNTATVRLLINYADTNVVDPVFADLRTGKLRFEPKLKGEGVAVSAHMVICLDPQPKSGTYLVALEDVPGVGRSKLAPFLTSEFKAVAHFPFRDVDDRVKASRPLVEILGHPSQQLRADLSSGTLAGIELVKMVLDGGEFDEEGLLKEERRLVRCKVQPRLRGEDALDLINRLRGRGHASGYSGLKVRFKRDAGNTRTVDVPTIREDAGDVQYVRYERVSGFDQPMEQSISDIRSDMLSKMLTLLYVNAAGAKDDLDSSVAPATRLSSHRAPDEAKV